MMRTLLFILLAVVILRMIQLLMRVMRNRGGRGYDSVFDSSGHAKQPPQQFRDIKDAEFEDLKSEKKQDDKGKAPE